MDSLQPCSIVHVDTSGQMPIGRILPENAPAYAIFWWRDVPLTHACVQQTAVGSDRQFLEHVFDALAPIVAHYAAESGYALDERAMRAHWLGQRQGEWNELMARIVPLSRGAFSAADVSVVVCTRNRPEQLRDCLQQLQQQASAPREIIVVDNASADRSTADVAAAFPAVTYCREDKKGLDIARNTGARLAAGPIVAYTDDDVVLHPMWTRQIAAGFDAPEVMGVTGLVLAAELETAAQVLFERYWSFNRGYLPRRYDRQYFAAHQDRGVPVWEIGAGANMAFRKTVFDRIGYFDERLDVGAAGCNGDSEYWYRILAAGYAIRYAPLAVAYHRHRRDMRSLRRQLFHYMRGLTAALHVQHERSGDAGNLRHLYLTLLPAYCKALPKAAWAGFAGQYSTYWHEITGIASGLLFYTRHGKSH